jgi:TATA-box binding protein (TBP) (component of TFIID and TFIIIB)
MSKRQPNKSQFKLSSPRFSKPKIDLQKIVDKFPQNEYNQSVPRLGFSIKKPKTSSLIFGTGQMVCTGQNLERIPRCVE